MSWAEVAQALLVISSKDLHWSINTTRALAIQIASLHFTVTQKLPNYFYSIEPKMRQEERM